MRQEIRVRNVKDQKRRKEFVVQQLSSVIHRIREPFSRDRCIPFLPLFFPFPDVLLCTTRGQESRREGGGDKE